MRLNGCEIIMEVLAEQGVDTVFGYPGGQVLNIYDALYKNQYRIKHILTAHEQGAAHAADGYSRASGKVGVCIATSGPGACNLITGLATANADSIPLVAITGNVAINMIGSDSFQEIDTIGLTIPASKHSFQVRDIDELAFTLREAFRVAQSGRPGPVLVDIPKNVQIAETEFVSEPKVEKTPDPMPDKELLDTAVEIINASNSPLIYCGGGVINGNCPEFIEPLAEKADAFVAFSMMGLTAMNSDSDRYLGMNGMHGHYASTSALAKADLIIAAGVRFADRATGNPDKFAEKAKIIHLDIDPAEHDKNITADIKIQGNLKASLKYILENIAQGEHPKWHETISKEKEIEASLYEKSDRMTAIDAIRTVNKLTEPDTLIATDVGQHQMWVAQEYHFKQPRTHLSSGGLGTMGYGLGAAIGGSIATGKRAVLFTGDGSFSMNLNELATAVSQNIPLTIVLLNNSCLGMIRQLQSLFCENRHMALGEERRTDFVKLAEAFGAKGYRAGTTDELEAAFKEAYQLNSPSLIECIIPSDELVLPTVPPNGSLDNIILQ
ncbi:MAG: biosynthetic-type acetolactate synthase large subunit [Clostridiales bacterium]|nr:biosynthetic-type acetolactate synthase large subunit [Clostridiales bacterium]